MEKTERCALFIDGSNFHTTKLLNIDVVILNCYIFVLETLIEPIIIRHYQIHLNSLRCVVIDFLDYNGYMIVSKLTREFTNHQTGEKRTKGNMDMELALDMLKLAPHLDHAVLFFGMVTSAVYWKKFRVKVLGLQLFPQLRRICFLTCEERQMNFLNSEIVTSIARQ